MEHRPLRRREFDRFTEALDYPMFVVTTTDGSERSGCLVGFTTQTGIDPPRFLVCLSDKNHTQAVAQGARLLAVHLLAEEQHDLAELFGGESGDEVDKFAGCSWSPGPDGVPLLDDCPRRMVGRIMERVPLGDHVGFLLEPVEVDAAGRGGDPDDTLTLQDVSDVEPGHDP
jgi:flavin reductase (DIM6/NTAB) family NADH-FMN oxidoreductase RutF